MHFILDANVVISEGFGQSARVSALLSASGAVGYTVYLPSPALEEITSEFSRRLAGRLHKTKQAMAELSGGLGRDVSSSLNSIEIASERQALRERLLAQLRDAEAQILDYPGISHEELVKRATERRRPFDSKGSGYRDSLIWQSAVDLAHSVSGPIVLVSSDKDFADDHGKLHQELKEELVRLGLPEDRIVLIPNLAELVENHVRPQLGLAPWDRPLEALAQKGLNLEDSIGMTIQDALLGQEWEPRELGLPDEYESPNLESVQGVSDLTILDTRSLPSDQLLIKVRANIEAEFQTFIFKPNWYGLDDPRLALINEDWNRHYLEAGIILLLECELDLVIDDSNPREPEIRDVSVALRLVDD